MVDCDNDNSTDITKNYEISIKNLLTKAPKNIDEWNEAYDSYMKREWSRLYPNDDAEYNFNDLKKTSKLIQNPKFIPPFWCEISGRNKPRSHYRVFTTPSKYTVDVIRAMDSRLERIRKNINVPSESLRYKNLHLYGAYLWHMNFLGTEFNNCCLYGATLRGVTFESVNFYSSNLEKADFSNSNCKGADFSGAYISDSKFEIAEFDGKTLFYNITYDSKSDFRGSNLSECRIDPNIMEDLRTNIRRKTWRQWYCKKPKLLHKIDKLLDKRNISKDNLMYKSINQILLFAKCIFVVPFVWIFWQTSRYGNSTISIFISIILWNLLWAIIYFHISIFDLNIISEECLLYGQKNIFEIFVYCFLMGFYPDILGSISSRDGAILSLLHMGGFYIILASLVTRLSIMFQNMGK